MLSVFLNPFTMVAGAILVSSPIIIHLINRLRFRRIRWAAMEFLLKSQKRNRRKLIIEQLILLALRILLVILVGMLLARYLGSALSFAQPRGTVHVVLLDDTASMSDFWREDGVNKDTFETAKRAIVEDIVGGAVQAGTPQALELYRLSALDQPYRIDRLNASTKDELKSHLNGMKPTALHVGWLPSLQTAREVFDRNPTSKHALHLVSDFRARDWAGADTEAVTQALATVTQSKGTGAGLYLIDAAHPPRSETQNTALDHGNVGILDLQPETRVAARFLPIDFTVTVANFTPAERKNVRVTVRVNGAERADSSTTIPSVPPGITQKSFTAVFDQPGFSQVSAHLEPEEAGLAIDNIRYAAIEVREKVPLLFIEGDLTHRGKPESDGFYLRALFLDAAKGFDVIQRGPPELEQPNLDQYPAIFLLNVARLTDKARDNLEAYAKAGGGVCFMLGEQCNVDFYNRLYGEGRGVFPVPLARATDPLTDQQRMDRIFDAAWPPKVFPRGDSHPILARIYRDDKNREVNTYLKFLFIDRYFPVPRAKWNFEPGKVEELFTLPNYRSMDDYKEEAQRLLNQIPVDDAQNARFQTVLKNHQRRVKEVLANGKQLYQLANAIEALITDTADPKEPEKPNLQEFWHAPARAELRGQFQRLLETVRFGDPLVVSSRFGKGHVVAYLTTAGSAWNDWPNGPARPYFVMLMLELQKFLAGAGTDVNRAVGAALEIALDANRFDGKMRRLYLPELSETATAAAAVDLGEQVGDVKGAKLSFVFADAKKPGVYRFEFTPKTGSAEGKARVEAQAFAFNVDTAAEGDLRRATRDDLEAAAPGGKLHAPGSGLADLLRERRNDLSESPWFYLLLLLVLIAEQAMAVRLSYHVNDQPTTAVSLATRTVT